uniref:MULE transposase domain-containing protein n=1 Tax=Ditylenchus dipsaci TaxID=166011 RepID=A0A915EJS9_9BILA
MTRNWKSVASCENEGEFFECKATNASWMKTWRYYKNQLSAKGINTKYRCGHNQKYNFGYDCKAEMRLRRPSNSEIVCIQVSGDCDHSKVEERKLDSPVKEKLRELESYGGPTLTATQMQKRLKNSLDRSKHQLPSPKQINDFVRYESMKAGQLVQMKLSDLKNYASQNSSQPGNLDESYVVSFKVSDDRKHWVLVWTTKRLTNAQIEQSRVNHLQIDATYKLLYQGFPYFPVGFSDANKKFFCSFTALCSGETTWCYAEILLAVRQVCSTLNAPYKPAFIMSDADTAIESGIFNYSRGLGLEMTHALCKFHVAKNFERYLPKAKLFEKQKHQMKEDFRTICAAQSGEEFDEASVALVSHWVAKYANAQRLLEAVEKFKQQWLDRYCFRGWYDAFVPIISTNNGLERLNLEIKSSKMESNKGTTAKLGFGLDELSESFFLPVPQVKPEKQVDDARLSEFCKEVFATLHSVIQGYADLLSLSRDYSTDSGKDPYKISASLGFKSFREFMHSEHMSKYVIIGRNNTDNEPTYCAAEVPDIKHIRKEQIETYQDLCKRRQKREGFTESKRTRPKLLRVAKINEDVGRPWDSPPSAPITPVNFTNKKIKGVTQDKSPSKNSASMKFDSFFSDKSSKQPRKISSTAPINFVYERVKEKVAEKLPVSEHFVASELTSFFSDAAKDKYVDEEDEDDDERYFRIKT